MRAPALSTAPRKLVTNFRGAVLSARIAACASLGIAIAAFARAAEGPPPFAGPPPSHRFAPPPDPDLPTGAPATRPDSPRHKQRGVALGLFAEDVSFSYAPLLAEIAALGATHVALVVSIYQTHGAAADLALHTRLSPTLGGLADAVRAARRERLEVTVLPIVRLTAPRRAGEWRGTLEPADRAAWFRRYTDVVGDIAAMAGVAGATRLAIGSELSSLDGARDLERWKPIVARLRAVFHGTLIYSANWDHYRDARLLDLCDEDGVVGYFDLRAGPAAPSDVAALEERWRRLRAELEAWQAGRNRAFVFTELGYRSRAGSSASPWDETQGGDVDLDEQRRAFEAFRLAWSGAPSLDGVYVWNWYGFGGPGTTSYTPRGKPAAAEVQRLLRAL